VAAAVAPALDRQQRLAGRLALLSPPLLLQDALTELAGTGASRHLRFMRQVAGFHDRHRSFFDPRTLRRQLLTSADYEQMPVFVFEDEPAAATLSRAALPLAGLIAWVAALLFRVRRAARAAVAS
jgi:ABC-2 type transport system permease protein